MGNAASSSAKLDRIAVEVAERNAEDSDGSEYEYVLEDEGAAGEGEEGGQPRGKGGSGSAKQGATGKPVGPFRSGWMRKKGRNRWFLLDEGRGHLHWFKQEPGGGAGGAAAADDIPASHEEAPRVNLEEAANHISLAVYCDISCEGCVIKVGVPSEMTITQAASTTTPRGQGGDAGGLSPVPPGGGAAAGTIRRPKPYALIAASEEAAREWALAFKRTVEALRKRPAAGKGAKRKKRKASKQAAQTPGAAAGAPAAPAETTEVMYTSAPGGAKVSVEDFDFLHLIGKGSFGKVFQVRHRSTDRIFAMKVLRKAALVKRRQVEHTRSERRVLQKTTHPFIVSLHFAFQTAHKVYMVLDFVNGGEVFFHLKHEGRFNEERVRHLGACLVSALSFLHSLDVVYRDLKPENVLIDMNGYAVITDFGLSKEVADDEATHTFCGTPEYLAPEVLKGLGMTKAVDWWSLGTILFEMLVGLPPFFNQNLNIMYSRILTGDINFPSHVSEPARQLLQGLLVREADQRLGSAARGGPGAVRQHAFFDGLDWDALERRDIPAPWLPGVESLEDVSQIDTLFTQELPVDSDDDGLGSQVKGPGRRGGGGNNGDDDAFSGFTFVEEGILSKVDKEAPRE